jgi:hypothetical protein
MINYKELVDEVAGRVTALEGKYAQKIAASVLGADVDCWGDIKSLSPEMMKAMRSRPEVVQAIESARARIAAEIVGKPFPVKVINGIARRIKERLLNDIEEQVYQEIYTSLEQEVQSIIRDKIATDPKLAPYFVASKIKEARPIKEKGNE